MSRMHGRWSEARACHKGMTSVVHLRQCSIMPRSVLHQLCCDSICLVSLQVECHPGLPLTQELAPCQQLPLTRRHPRRLPWPRPLWRGR